MEAASACVDDAEAMRIFVKMPCGKTIKVDVVSSETIEALKTKIQDKERIPACEQRITYEGENLVDGYTLVDYDIQQDVLG